MKLSAALFGIGIACVTMCVAIADTTGADPFLWLEDVKGDRALRWVKSQNESTFSELKADPAYEQTRAAADLILSSRCAAK